MDKEKIKYVCLFYRQALTLHGFMLRHMRNTLLSMSLLWLCVLAVSCKFGTEDTGDDGGADSTEVDSAGLEQLDLFKEAVIPESADELFDDFLFSYISSQKFKDERTKMRHETLSLTEDQSVIVIYERENDLELQKDTSLVHVLLEKIEWGEDQMELYDFNRIHGKWYLTGDSINSVFDTPNASFLEFLKSFITDADYQYESLRLPILFKCFSEDEEEIITRHIEYDEWMELVNDLPDMKREVINIDYGQSLISTNRKSVLLKGLSNGLLITFHFDFSGGRWYLFEIES